MPAVLLVTRAGSPEPERVALAAAATAVGGSRADGIVVAGAAPAALLLLPAPDGLVVVAQSSGVRAAGHPLAPAARRLLRPGERAELPGAVLALAAAPSDAPDAATRVRAAALLAACARGEAHGTEPHLLVLTGPAAGTRVPLAEGATILGRSAGAAVRLEDELVSRRHARVRRADGALTVEDLGAKNGVRVNGARLERRAAPLRDGDELAIGATLLAVVDPGTRRAPAATAPPRSAPAAARGGDGRRGTAARCLAAALLLACSAVALAAAGW